MSKDQIEKFLQEKFLDKVPIMITFKTRESFVGLFIKTPDYSELKSKNFWRIVAEPRMESYHKSKDMNLARIFNGVEITRLSVQ